MAVSTRAGSAPRRLTYDDYARLDDGRRYQLIDGILHEMSAPSEAHQTLLLELAVEFRIFLRAHPLGKVLAAPFDVVLDPYQVLQPDLMVFSNERRSKVLANGKYADGAPDLAIEILSPATQALDLGRKRELYAEFGFGELWILAQDRPHAEVYRTVRKGRFTRPGVLGRDDHLTTPLLPGLSLSLAEIYAKFSNERGRTAPPGPSELI